MNKPLAKFIDHTLLRPDATKRDIDQIIQEAITYKFYSVCINSHWVSYCYERLKDTDIKICTVVGFPLGATSTAVKTYETKEAIQNGASEIDMVMNIGELKANRDDFVKKDIESVVEVARNKAIVKVIIETSLLTDGEKVHACQLAKVANADFVKTSTGFSGGGATVEDIKLMRETVGHDMGVKASGGIRNKTVAEKMIRAGASRIGASSSVAIVLD